jgi:hypothetical protein
MQRESISFDRRVVVTENVVAVWYYCCHLVLAFLTGFLLSHYLYYACPLPWFPAFLPGLQEWSLFVIRISLKSYIS